MNERQEEIPELFATLMGFSALLLWALSCFVLSELHTLPTFQISATVFFMAFAATCILLTKNKRWGGMNQPNHVFFIGFAAVFINQAAFVYAVKLIPPEQAEIIYYLWPIMALLISTLFFENRKSIVPIFSAMLGLSGIYFLLVDGEKTHQFNENTLVGYLFAFSSGIAWMVYSLFTRYNPHIPSEMNGIWCGLAGGACFIIHIFCETTVLPSPYEWMLMSFIGLMVLVLSLKLWTTGLRYGHFNVLTVSAYFTPLTSLLILMAFEKTPFRSSIFLACQLIILGGILCSFQEWFQKKLDALIHIGDEES